MIKWLHLSDVHLNKKGVTTRRMRSKLLTFLTEKEIQCEYVFFTGDLRDANDGKFADDTISFLQELCTAVGTSVENLFVVPGNHDIDRGIAERIEAITNVCTGEDAYYDFNEGIIDEKDLEHVYLGKIEFNSLIEKLYVGQEDRIAKYKDKRRPHFCVETPDFNILHIDTTISYTKHHQTNLIIGTELLLDLLEGINQNKPTILLTHYSFDFLDRNEQKAAFRLLEDYNVQLWFAGHEHAELLRKQWDYFFEFQCGNLLHEDEYTKGAVILGEYNADSFSGAIRVFAWDSSGDWTQNMCINRHGQDQSIYPFELQTSDAKINQIVNSVDTLEVREIGDGVSAFNLNQLNMDILRQMPEDEFLQIREQMKPKLQGKESREEIAFKFLHEIKMTLEDKQRYDCLPMFRNVVRAVYDGHVYLDGNLAPFKDVRVSHFFFENNDFFHIFGDGFQLIVTQSGGEVTDMTFGYQLSTYPNVADRLLRFDTVREYIEAKAVHVKMVGNENYNISFENPLGSSGWRQMVENTELWYDQMLRIAKIEQYYGIKFHLPSKASEEDYLAIDIVSDSIDKKSCRHIPVTPAKHPGFRKKFVLEEEKWMNDGTGLMKLPLFGYTFKPIAQYILPGEFRWNKRLKGWESDFKNGGIAVRVEFEVCYDDDKDYELTKYIPFEELKDDFKDKEIVVVSDENVELFNVFVRVTHDLQKIWQSFLLYKEQLDKYIIYEQDEQRRLIHKTSGKVVDKIAINEMTTSIVYSGYAIVEQIEALIAYMSDHVDDHFPSKYSRKWFEESIGFCFMIAMKRYARNGHLPVSVSEDGYCFYDFMNIMAEINSDSDTQLQEVVPIFADAFNEAQLDLSKIDHYNMMRNFMYTIAEIHKSYYEQVQSVLFNIEQEVQYTIEQFPDLEMLSGRFAGYIIYMLEGEENLHAFEKDSNILRQFCKYRNEAEEYFEECSIGKNELMESR